MWFSLWSPVLRCKFTNGENDELKGLLVDKVDKKNQLHQIVPTLNLTALIFNGILNVDFFEIQSNNN